MENLLASFLIKQWVIIYHFTEFVPRLLQDVRIALKCHRDGTVPQMLRDRHDGDALRQRGTRPEVPEVVKTHFFQSGREADLAKIALHKRATVGRASERVREYKIQFIVEKAFVSCGVFDLIFPPLLNLVGNLRRDVNRSLFVVLRLFELPVVTWRPIKGMRDFQPRPLNTGPRQAQDFPLPHS